jgi:hypothetical protein
VKLYSNGSLIGTLLWVWPRRAQLPRPMSAYLTIDPGEFGNSEPSMQMTLALR